jgi:hypothetical protein
MDPARKSNPPPGGGGSLCERRVTDPSILILWDSASRQSPLRGLYATSRLTPTSLPLLTPAPPPAAAGRRPAPGEGREASSRHPALQRPEVESEHLSHLPAPPAAQPARRSPPPAPARRSVAPHHLPAGCGGNRSDAWICACPERLNLASTSSQWACRASNWRGMAGDLPAQAGGDGSGMAASLPVSSCAGC